MVNDSLARFRALQANSAPQTFNSDTTSSAIEGNAQAIEAQRAQIEAYLDSVRKSQEQSQPSEPNMTVDGTTEAPSYDFTTPVAGESAVAGNIPKITQAFGNRSSVEAFSKGVNLGTDFGVKKGTPLALPPGEWEVMTTFTGAKEGNRGANSGSGNLVKVVNTKTGEMLAFEHLSGVGVRPGQRLNGGTVVGLSGNTGNSTGPHASIPYQDASGKYHDIMSSPYAKYIFGQVNGSSNGKGGGIASIGNKAMEALKLLSSLVPKTLPIKDQVAQLQNMSKEDMQKQALDLIVAGTVSPMESSLAKEMSKVVPAVEKYVPNAMQQAMTQSLNKYRRVLKPWGGPMEEAMSKSLNQNHPLIKEIPEFLKDGVSKFIK